MELGGRRITGLALKRNTWRGGRYDVFALPGWSWTSPTVLSGRRALPMPLTCFVACLSPPQPIWEHAQ